MIVDKDVSHDARVRKEATSLAAQGWRVVVIGMSRSGREPAEEQEVNGFILNHIIARWLRQSLGGKSGHLLRTLEGYVKAAVRLRQVNARVYHAHDFTGLVIVAMAGIWRRPVVYDSHEIYFERPMRTASHLLSVVLRPLERVLARRAIGMIATTEARAQYFVEALGVSMPVIVRNAFDLMSEAGPPVNFALKSQYLIAHSGWLMHGRHLLELVQALTYLPENVSLVLVGDGWLRDQLEAKARELGVDDRFEIVGEVLPQQMVSTLAQATVAAVLINADSISYRLSLPNKFFEAVAAGLPIIASPIPEVKRMIEKYDIGAFCDPNDPQSIAQAIISILEPGAMERLRANVLHARTELNWQAEEQKLVAMYNEMFDVRGMPM
jgi:glycosyltransferase involved in cell wall biosynthesis